ncbi:hypothetical protein Efla_001499 [Eimeria flavescens]
MSPLPSVCAQQDRFGRLLQQMRPTATMYQQSRSFQRERSPKLFLRRSCRSFKTSLTSRKRQQPCLHRGIINTLFPSTPTPNLSEKAPNDFNRLESSIQQRLSNGGIRPSCSSWASPAFFVSKENGELRLVVDYRGLNSPTQTDKFPLPLIDVFIDKMSKSKVFSRLDLRNGFYKIRMADGDIFKSLSAISPAGVQPLAANESSILFMPPTISPRPAARRFLARITCDAASFGIGAVLEQQHPDGWHPAQFLSRTHSKPETNYPVIEKEWLAVRCALTKWRYYLQQHF